MVDVLAPELLQNWRATQGDFLIYSSGGKSLSNEARPRLDAEHDRFLLENSQTTILKPFERGFLPRFRDSLCGDWTGFYLLSARIPLATVQSWGNEVPSECQIFIRC